MSEKTKVLIYLVSIGLMTVVSFVIAPLSVTSVFIAVAFVVNVLLFRDVFSKDK